MRKKISIITPSFNEENGIEECYLAVKKIFTENIQGYDYEHIFIDNCSEDKTVNILKSIAEKDINVKIIVNSRNFGLSKSPYYGLLQMHGDAAILVVADLQTPTYLIPELVAKWEEGYKVVLAVRKSMSEGMLIKFLRNLFYKIISSISNIEQTKHFIGYGIFDKKIIDIMRGFDDPAPYFRGIISEIGFKKAIIEYDQPPRKYGKSKHSFFDLLELALLGITNYSTAPLRVMSIVGLILSILSFFIALLYFILKIIYWDNFNLGIAPVIIGIFMIGSLQLLFLGIIGEYIKVLYDNIKKRPLVIEDERINFD